MAGGFGNAMRRLGLAPTDSEETGYYEGGDEPLAEVTPIHRGQAQGGADQMHRIVTARLRGYSEAKTVGTPYRDGIPVIMNLSDVTNEADAQRLVDFAGGLTYALHGKLERITTRVFLLSPASIRVSEASRASAADYYEGE